MAQSYEEGGEAQVDWYEAWAEFQGELRKIFIFCLRSMASGGAFHRAYLRANQQAFLALTEYSPEIFTQHGARIRVSNIFFAVNEYRKPPQQSLNIMKGQI